MKINFWFSKYSTYKNIKYKAIYLKNNILNFIEAINKIKVFINIAYRNENTSFYQIIKLFCNILIFL